MNEFDDPFSLHPQSRPSGHLDDEGREIRSIGPPTLKRDLATSPLLIPDDCRQYMLCEGPCFFTLPRDVIDIVVEEIGEARFNSDQLEMERRLSDICGDHTRFIGFWRDTKVAYSELRQADVLQSSEEFLRGLGQDPAAYCRALQVYQDRDVEPLGRFSRGYCGWLMTNREFLDEHDTLLAKHSETVCNAETAGIIMSTFAQSSFAANASLNTGPHHSKFVRDFDQFLVRWRLAGLAGPYLPIPAKPMMGGITSTSAVEQLMSAGGVFFLPDTMPIPSRDQLRGMLDDALHRGEKPEHLSEWLGIIRANNPAKNQMDPFIRRFELQHYWRLFQRRHASAIHRKVGKLESAFDKYFKMKPRKTFLDLIKIRRQLGSDWVDRPWPIGPVDSGAHGKPR